MVHKLLPIAGIALVLSLGFSSKSNQNFKYRYEIISNSNSVSDLYDLYRYKEHLIERYEYHLLTVDDNFRTTFLESYIDLLDYEDAKTQYVNGVIIQVIGKGYGRSISGDLRKSTCDEEAIRDRYFIFDLFNR